MAYPLLIISKLIATFIAKYFYHLLGRVSLIQTFITKCAKNGKTFAIWALVSAVLGFVFPTFFASLAFLIVPILGIIMFGMGMTLKTEDFLEIVKRPKPVLVGLLAQFTLMPLIAYLLTIIFDLDPLIAVDGGSV